MAMKSRIEDIRVEHLTVDDQVQRSLREARVEELAKDFNPDGLGVITVSRRDDGTNIIVDGQHRWAAARKAGHPKLKAQVYLGLSLQDEAALFRVHNNTRIVSAFDRFRVRLIEEEPVATELMGYLSQNGWKLSIMSSLTAGAFAAVGAIEWVYNGCGGRAEHKLSTVTRTTIEVLTAAWGHASDTMAAGLVRGVGLFLATYAGTINLDKLIREMKRAPGGAPKFLADSKFTSSHRRMPLADAVADSLTGIYNRKLSAANRLPEWNRQGE